MVLPKDLVAASAAPIILSILKHRDNYGYAIIKRVQEVSGDQIAWTEGMLYPVLHRMESAGFITSDWRVSENGRRRKYYQITDSGRSECDLLRSQWHVVHHALQVLDEVPAPQGEEGNHV
jgi:DNA-binding PadR family transcriptional regulator